MNNKIKIDPDLITNNRFSNTLDTLSVQIKLIEGYSGPKEHLLQLKREVERIRLMIALTKASPNIQTSGPVQMEWD
jgi:hypothetical protein